MIWWQYPVNDVFGDDGVTISFYAGHFFASCQSELSVDDMKNAVGGNGSPRPIGQMQGLDFENYTKYRADLTQNPPTLIKRD